MLEEQHRLFQLYKIRNRCGKQLTALCAAQTDRFPQQCRRTSLQGHLNKSKSWVRCWEYSRLWRVTWQNGIEVLSGMGRIRKDRTTYVGWLCWARTCSIGKACAAISAGVHELRPWSTPKQNTKHHGWSRENVLLAMAKGLEECVGD